VNEKTFIGPESRSSLLPDSKVLILATGAQGDEFAALMRIAMKTHKYVKIKKNDTIVLSSSIVPGNERSVQKLKDNLSRQGARIIHRDQMDVHASGHANRDETFWIHKRSTRASLCRCTATTTCSACMRTSPKQCGRSEDEIVVPDNGAVIEIQDEGKRLSAAKRWRQTACAL
jgi:ribonuclease J